METLHLQKTGVFTTDSNTKKLGFYAKISDDGTATIQNAKIMIYESATEKDYEPYTNGASPNPSYSQEIEVVRGKNLFDKNSVTTGYYYNLNGTLMTSNNWNVEQVEVQPNTNYYLSGNNYNNEIAGIVLLDKDKNYISLVSSYKNVHLITTTATTKYIGLSIANYSDNSDMNTIQLEKGSQATSYLPYNTLEVVERGKNILDMNLLTTISNNRYISSGTNHISIQPNTTYTFSVKSSTGVDGLITIYDKSGNSTATYAQSQASRTSVTFTTGVNDSYFIIDRWYIDSTAIVLADTEPMLEQGSSATDYEPYQIPQTYQLSLGEYEFAKIGDYVDTIEYDVDEDKVYKNVNVGKQILNGDETITLGAISDNTVRIRYSYDLLPYTPKGDLLGLCNRLLAKNIWDIDEEGFFFYGKQIIMRINKETVGTTPNSINAWLENNNMIFNYALEEEIKEEITTILADQIKALYNSQSFNGTTIIEINGQLPLIIKVKALKG